MLTLRQLQSAEREGFEMATRVNHQDIVRRVLEEKAIDFNAVGRVVAEIGPALSLADEPWDGFCGTMRTFFHCFIITHPPVVVEAGPAESE
jgi:hypothetical protein